MVTATLKRTSAIETFNAIQQWEHWDIIGKVAAKEYGMSSKEYQRLLPEYQRFIALSILGVSVPMQSSEVDKIWHSHILHMKLYEGLVLWACDPPCPDADRAFSGELYLQAGAAHTAARMRL